MEQQKEASFKERVLRFLLDLLVKVFFRIRVEGLENIPKDKGALLVCNHVSFLDGIILNAALGRPIRFIVERYYYNRKSIRHFCNALRLIPISTDDTPREIIASLQQARKAMDSGEVVCIFAEGSITRNGMMQEFKSGFKRITHGTDYNIVPTFIGGMWNTVLSYYYEKPFSRIPLRLPYKLGVHLGSPMPSDTSAGNIRKKVSELSCEYFESLKPDRRPMGEMFVSWARKNWFRKSISDSTGKSLTFGQTLTASIVLSKILAERVKNQDKVAILLPASVGGALANVAITMLGKAVVNLNFTAARRDVEHAISQCGIETIISSKIFLKRLGSFEDLDNLVYIEDLLKKVTPALKIKSLLLARFAPTRMISKIKDFDADTIAAVVYSSGSSGRPKGVMLSHHNIISNIESCKMVFKVHKDDNICGVLPFFHSFGYTATLWLPLLGGTSACYSPNPLDPITVGQQARINKSTMLLGTPTFIGAYNRRTPPEDFANLRLVVVGAEKLKKNIADAFEQRFGIKPLEGYGATELSPVAMVNIPDVSEGEFYQRGCKEGAVGHPIPGVAVRVVDIETGQELPLGRQGLLYVKGPNVMLGYLGMPEETAEVIRDGWYNTGDIVIQDADGFVTMTDRLSRFSKIGGEMVSHYAIEEVFMEAGRFEHQVIAVSSVPDERKGEEIVVLYLPEVRDMLEEFFTAIDRSSLPNLWKPKRSNYFEIKEMPLLGSGKIDILKLRKIALEAKFNI